MSNTWSCVEVCADLARPSFLVWECLPRWHFASGSHNSLSFDGHVMFEGIFLASIGKCSVRHPPATFKCERPFLVTNAWKALMPRYTLPHSKQEQGAVEPLQHRSNFPACRSPSFSMMFTSTRHALQQFLALAHVLPCWRVVRARCQGCTSVHGLSLIHI